MIKRNSLQSGEYVYRIEVHSKNCKAMYHPIIRKYDVRNKSGDIFIRTSGNYHTTNITGRDDYFPSILECIVDHLKATVASLTWKIDNSHQDIVDELKALRKYLPIFLDYIPNLKISELIEGTMNPSKLMLKKNFNPLLQDIKNIIEKSREQSDNIALKKLKIFFADFPLTHLILENTQPNLFNILE